MRDRKTPEIINGGFDCSYADLGVELGVSRQRAQQIERALLQKVERALDRRGLDRSSAIDVLRYLDQARW